MALNGEKDGKRLSLSIPRATDGTTQLSFDEAEKRYGSIHDSLCHVTLGDRPTAIEFVKWYAPDIASEFDVDNLEILSNEIYDDFMGKNVLDFVFRIPPKLDGLPLDMTLIVEHKSWGGGAADQEIVNQLLYYFALVCRRRYADWKEAKKEERPAKLAQPLVLLLYSGKNVDYEPPKWEVCYPLPSSLQYWGVRFPIVGVNLTRAYRKGELVGSPFLRVMGELLATASLGELPDVYKRIFLTYNEVDEWGDRERKLVRANFAYTDRALKNLDRPLTLKDALDINANLRKQEVRDTMISYFDELKLEGKIEGKIEGRVEGKVELFRVLVDGKFSFCPEQLYEKCAQIADNTTLDRICAFVAYKAKTLEDVMDFVDEQIGNTESSVDVDRR